MKFHPFVIADHVRETSKRGSALDGQKSKSRVAITILCAILCVAVSAALIFELILV